MINTDYKLIVETMKTVDAAVIASQVPQESITAKRKPFSGSYDSAPDTGAVGPTASDFSGIQTVPGYENVTFEQSRKCSIYLHPNLEKLQKLSQDHLKSLEQAKAFMEDYLGIQNKEPQGFPEPGFMRTSNDLEEWRKSNFFYNVTMCTADRIPICTYDPAPYKPDKEKTKFDRFFDFVKSKCCKISDENFKAMIKIREECLNTAYNLKHNFEGDHFLLKERGSRKTAENCPYCLDFVRQHADECNYNLNEPEEEEEEVIEKRIEHLIAELKRTNSKNVSVIDKLTARFVQKKERLLKEEEMDENAKQMWDLYLKQLKEPGLQQRKDELDQRKKKHELAQRKKEHELAQRKKKRLRTRFAESEEEGLDYTSFFEECVYSSSSEESLNEPESEIFVPAWDADIKKLISERELMVLEYQKLKSKKIYEFMSEDLILSLNKTIHNHLKNVRSQKTVSRYLRKKVKAPIVI